MVNGVGAIDINTNVDTLAAVTTNANIIVDEDSGLALNDVNAGNGDVTMTLAAGALTSNSGAKITADEVALTAPAGINVNTNINELTASTTNADITVTEDSGTVNNINAGTGDVAMTLVAGTLTSNGVTEITANDLAINGSGAIDINTNVDTLAAITENADITVDENDGIGRTLWMLDLPM